MASMRSIKLWAPSWRIPKLLVYVIGFLPALWTFYLGLSDQLGAEPIRALQRTLGLWALRFLLATLTITPLRQSLHINLLRYRRALGLLAFYYATLHLVVYVALDHQFDFQAIWADMLKRRYITVGMLAFVMLVPLAITSNDPMIRRMGAQAWKRLHRLVYLTVIAAALHFILLVKSWPLEPLAYAAGTALLLAYRLMKPAAKKSNDKRARGIVARV